MQLQKQLYDDMAKITPLPSIYFPDFIAANQSSRADNVLSGTKQEQLDKIRSDIREFKEKNGLDKVTVERGMRRRLQTPPRRARRWAAETEKQCAWLVRRSVVGRTVNCGERQGRRSCM